VPVGAVEHIFNGFGGRSQTFGNIVKALEQAFLPLGHLAEQEQFGGMLFQALTVAPQGAIVQELGTFQNSQTFKGVLRCHT
jgi:hypothetical protein